MFPVRASPGDNAHIEAFNSLVRRECLSQHWFSDLEDARRILEVWRKEYNEVRPHGGFGPRGCSPVPGWSLKTHEPKLRRDVADLVAQNLGQEPFAHVTVVAWSASGVRE